MCEHVVLVYNLVISPESVYPSFRGCHPQQQQYILRISGYRSCQRTLCLAVEVEPFLPSTKIIPSRSVLESEPRSNHNGGGSRLVATITYICSDLTHRSVGFIASWDSCSFFMASCTANDCLSPFAAHPHALTLSSHPSAASPSSWAKKVKFSFVRGSALGKKPHLVNSHFFS